MFSTLGGFSQMQEAWRAYLELAFGLTEASRKKAQQVVRDLVGRGETTATQVQHAVSDLLATSRENRETMIRLIRYEVDRAIGGLGLASADEVADLTARVQELERRVREGPGGPSQAPATKAVAKKTVAKKTVAKEGATKKPAKRAASKKPAKKAAAKRAA